MKSTSTYWNTLSDLNSDKWEDIEGSEGNLSQLTIAEDSDTGDYTRLTKFKAGYNSKIFGAKEHEYPEEIFIVYGRLFDEAVGVWLEQGTYASRPPGELHGPFFAESDVLVLEVSLPSQIIKTIPNNKGLI